MQESSLSTVGGAGCSAVLLVKAVLRLQTEFLVVDHQQGKTENLILFSPLIYDFSH